MTPFINDRTGCNGILICYYDLHCQSKRIPKQEIYYRSQIISKARIYKQPKDCLDVCQLCYLICSK